MSIAEIQDNKWEVQASKVQIMTPSGLGLVLMMGAFVLFFTWITIYSVIGAFTETSTMDFDKKQKVDADGKAIQAPAE